MIEFYLISLSETGAGGDKETGDGQIVSMILLTLVQVAVSAYLLLQHSPDLSFSGDSVVCAASFQQRLHGHLYNTLLLATIVILYLRHTQAQSSNKHRDQIRDYRSDQAKAHNAP